MVTTYCTKIVRKGGAEGVTKANCEAVDLMVDDISEVGE